MPLLLLPMPKVSIFRAVLCFLQAIDGIVYLRS